MAGAVEILPRRFIGTDYTQSIEEAIDAGGANFAALQVWLDPPLTGAVRSTSTCNTTI